MPNKLPAKLASKLGLKVGYAAAKKREPEPAAIPQELPMGPSAAHFYFLEARRILRTLQAMIQFGDPDSKLAVEATFSLAHIATHHSALAAHNPRTASVALSTAKRMDSIAVLRAGNSKNLPWYSKALDQLTSKTFHSYKSRGPHRKGANIRDIEMGQWVEDRIHTFWPGVISRGRRIPHIPDQVRVVLLSPRNRLNGRKWAGALLDDLPKEPNSSNPFEVYDQGKNQAFFERQVPERKNPNADRVRAGFVKFAGERFYPLLKAEVEQAESSYTLLMRELCQTNITSG
jgi:hypothetical protein